MKNLAIIIVCIVYLGSFTLAKDEESFIISDMSKWQHPTKQIFTEQGYEIEKVELLNNKKYPVFFLKEKNDKDAEIENLELLKKIAKKNGFWDFKIVMGNKYVIVKCTGDKRIDSVETEKNKYRLFKIADKEYIGVRSSFGKMNIPFRENPPEKTEAYNKILKLAESLPAKNIKNTNTKANIKIEKYKEKIDGFYSELFVTHESEIKEEYKQDYLKNKAVVDKILKFLESNPFSINYTEIDTTFVAETGKTVILKSNIGIVASGVMSPIPCTNFIFYTEVEKGNLLIDSIAIEEGSVPVRDTYLTYEYDDMVENYSRNNEILNVESSEMEGDSYKKKRENLLKGGVKIPNEKIVTVLTFGVITKTNTGKYNFYSIDYRENGSKMLTKKISGYDKILYITPETETYIIAIYKDGGGIEYYDTVTNKVILKIGGAYLNENYSAENIPGLQDYSFFSVAAKIGKNFIYDNFGDCITKEGFDKIERENIDGEIIFRLRNKNVKDSVYAIPDADYKGNFELYYLKNEGNIEGLESQYNKQRLETVKSNKGVLLK